jgi:hypothetical protein
VRELRHNSEEQQKHKVEELIGTHISDESWRNLVHGARAAAEQGVREFMLLRFPSQLCSDGGRAVNVPDQSGRRLCVVRPPRFTCDGAMI